MTGVYTGLAQLVVLVLVLLFALFPGHSLRSRLIVGCAYLLAVGLPRLMPLSPLVPLLMQVLLGIVLLIWRRWDKGPEALF
jgi:hypothetical protein